MKYDIWVDGSCRGNGKEENCGGWGVVVTTPVENNNVCVIDTLAGSEKNTTNNRTELIALLDALDYACERYSLDKNSYFTIHCDSAYCVNIFNEWIRGWAKNNWTRSKSQPIENLDLIKKLYNYVIKEFPPYKVVKTSGHSGIIGNEIADALATSNQTKLAKILKENEVPYV